MKFKKQIFLLFLDLEQPDYEADYFNKLQELPEIDKNFLFHRRKIDWYDISDPDRLSSLSARAPFW